MKKNLVFLIISLILFLSLSLSIAKDNIQTITITAWTIGPDRPSFYRRDNLVDAGRKLNSLLEKEGSNIRVKVEATFDTGTWADYKQKFILSASAGKAPDIILSGHEDVAPWGEAGYIIPLDDLIKKYKDTTDLKDIIPTLWKSVQYKEKTWAIPQDSEARPLYYRKDLLKKLGWTERQINDLPKKIQKGEFTIYDMLELAKTAQDKGIIAEGYGFWPRPRKGNDFYIYYYNFGGEMQDPKTGKLILVKDALRRYYQLFADTIFKYKTTPEKYIGMEWRIWHESVVAGKVLFWQGGTWHWAEWQQVYKADPDDMEKNVGYALVPPAENGKPGVTLTHPLAYMVTKNSKYPELAFRLIALAINPVFDARHAVTSAHLPVLTSTWKQSTYYKNKFLREVEYMLKFTTFIPNSSDFGTYDEIVFKGVSAVANGDVTPESAVDIVVRDLENALGDRVIIK
jgi:inositol-phosphate transport system substrate-binding protein